MSGRTCPPCTAVGGLPASLLSMAASTLWEATTQVKENGRVFRGKRWNGHGMGMELDGGWDGMGWNRMRWVGLGDGMG